MHMLSNHWVESLFKHRSERLVACYMIKKLRRFYLRSYDLFFETMTVIGRILSPSITDLFLPGIFNAAFRFSCVCA